MLRQNKKSYTLQELMMVIIILGAVVGFALPRFGTAVEWHRAQEAVYILKLMFKEQGEFAIDNNAYMTGAISLLPNLSIGFPDLTVKGWTEPEFIGGSSAISCNGVMPNLLGWTSRTGYTPAYYLYLLQDGRVVCIGDVLFDCNDAICQQLGFPTTW